MKTILLTGMAGFVGFHMTNRLLHDYPGITIVGLDNVNDYYDVSLKCDRLRELGFEISGDISEQEIIKSKKNNNLHFVKADLKDKPCLTMLFKKYCFHTVINLAAQAGVRYSLVHPEKYIESNIDGFLNILECCRAHPVGHLLYASSSSVYGLNDKIPFSEDDKADKPASLYACTKKMNESMAFTYAHLFGIKSSGLRFFTVYGEWGRPDMAYFSFTRDILDEKPICVYNYGKMSRDFTYVGDVVAGISDLLDKPPDNLEIPSTVYNIGNNNPVLLEDFISAIETALGKDAIKEYHPMSPGDVPQTYADVDKLMKKTLFKPSTKIDEGIGKFVEWYKQYYKI